MRLLAIETATDVCSVSVADENRIISESTVFEPRKHSELLATLIQEQTEDRGYPLESFDGVAVSIGPGSFTGLRIGLSTAKGILFGSGRTLFAIPTLMASAWGARHVAERVGVLHHSHRDHYFYADYRLTNPVETLQTPVRKELGELTDYIQQHRSLVFQAPSETVIPAEIQPDCILRNSVSASNVAELALAFPERFGVKEIHHIEPDYLRDYKAAKFANPLDK